MSDASNVSNVKGMRGRVLRRVLLFLVLVLVLGVLVDGMRQRFGAGITVTESLPQTCTALPAPAGPEDIAIDAATGMAVISALDRRDDAVANGGLWLLDSTRPAARPVRLTGVLPAVFRPHGLSLVRQAGALHALVVNHLDDGHSIEVLRIDPATATLEHIATHGGSALVSPNDVAAVDLQHFYVSNDHGSGQQGLGRLSEDLLGLNRANIVYFDGTRFVTVLEGLTFANGVTLAQDDSVLYVSETLDQRVGVYAREPLSGRLSPQMLIELEAGPDNLDVATDGSLWIAAHPNLLDFLAHARDADQPSASVVYRVALQGDALQVRRVLADDGQRFSGISVAAHHQGVTLLGGVFDGVLMRCTELQPTAAGRLAPLDLPDS